MRKRCESSEKGVKRKLLLINHGQRIRAKRFTKIRHRHIAPPSTSDFLGEVVLNLANRPVYFFLQSKDCVLEAFLLLAGVGVHEH